MGRPGPDPGRGPAGGPQKGRAKRAAAQAPGPGGGGQARRAARARQIALIEAARPKWMLPIPKGKFVISSCFEPRWGTFHYGVDMAAPEGTPFYAAGDGTVVEAGPMSGFGNAIMIQHADG